MKGCAGLMDMSEDICFFPSLHCLTGHFLDISVIVIKCALCPPVKILQEFSVLTSPSHPTINKSSVWRRTSLRQCIKQTNKTNANVMF